MICISNCDKITPGMLIATMRLNIPTVFVSGGPMEAGPAGSGAAVADAPRPQARPDRPDGRLGRPVGVRRRAARHGGVGLPDLRLLLGHVHRQLDELPDRGDRPGPAGQRHHAGHARGPARAVRAGRDGRSSSITRRYYERRRRLGAAAGGGQPGRVRERDGPGRGHGRVDQHDPAPAGRGPRGGSELRPQGDRRAVPPGAVPVQGRAQQQLPRGGRAPGGRHPGHPGRAGPGRACSTRSVQTVHGTHAAGVPGRLGRALGLGPATRPWSCTTPRPGGVRTIQPYSQSARWEELDLRPDQRLHPRSGPRLHAPTAAWPCCTATWLRTARSSRPPACPRSC